MVLATPRCLVVVHTVATPNWGQEEGMKLGIMVGPRLGVVGRARGGWAGNVWW